jgi:hypothetical protein
MLARIRVPPTLFKYYKALGEKIRTFENEVCEVKQTVSSVETSAQYMSEVFEEVKTNAGVTDVKKLVFTFPYR